MSIAKCEYNNGLRNICWWLVTGVDLNLNLSQDVFLL